MKTGEALAKIFYRPLEVFAEQKKNQTWGRIVLLLVAISLADTTMNNVSSSWHHSTDSIAQVNGLDQQEETRSNVSDSELTTRFTVYSDNDSDRALPTLSDVVFTLISMFLLIFVEAIYLRAVSAILDLDLKLDHWLSLVSWSRVPGEAFILLTTVVLGIFLFVSSELLGVETVMLTRLMQGSDSSYPSIGFFLDYWILAEIWVLALMTIGFRDWSGKSTLVSFAIVSVPTLLIFGLLWWLVV